MFPRRVAQNNVPAAWLTAIGNLLTSMWWCIRFFIALEEGEINRHRHLQGALTITTDNTTRCVMCII